MTAGDIKKVKFFNNCKGEPLFPIPLNQVNNQNNILLDQCIYACANKGLPSSMHYSYINGDLEEECHLLDLKLALQLSTDAELTTTCIL